MVGLVYSDAFLAHGETWHPESSKRLEATIQHLRETGWLERMQPLEFGPATMEQVQWLHDASYIEDVKAASEAGGESFTIDTVATADTWDAALLAAGGSISATRAAMAGDAPMSLCLVRPPGHHALSDRAMGFCFINNVALAAESAIRAGLERVAIVDFDVHHGNGTQEMFYHRRDVLYISTHEYGLFPGTGNLDEVGVEDGAGYTVNIPLLPNAGDGHYRTVFGQVIVPALDEFRPELILVSAGFDGHYSDHIAHHSLSLRAYHDMTGDLLGVARRHCEGRLVFVLEGGYDLNWLPLCVENSLRAMEGQDALLVPESVPQLHESQLERLNEALEHAVNTHRDRLGFSPWHLA